MAKVRVRVVGSDKVVLVDPDATYGAIIGKNVYLADGVTLFNPAQATASTPSGGTVSLASGTSTPGSNSGYPQASSPATAQPNFDLDFAQIAGFSSSFPTVNYILVGNGAAWVAVPMTGDASILASGAIKAFPGANMAASATMPNRRVRFTANNVAGTLPVPATDFQDQYILIESALTGCSVVANAGYTVNGLASLSLDITPCSVHLVANTDAAVKNWFVAEIRLGVI